ncbi:hypothetical protein RRG08_028162 [Elysia crispata]|uniref:ShKT domain-containing protein n=1 Tax=Elysia crispata TaxID=231223 RepID=A0AAE0YR13_9GAST|nr:hypothetical protein RRG08_028162 [Elysia crispata]
MCNYSCLSQEDFKVRTMFRAAVLPLTLLVGFAIWAVTALESEWNQAARDHIVDVHNDYRKNEGGCQMDKIEYDMGLEAQAKKWAEGCVFEHEMVKGRGENLAYSTSSDPENDMITSAAKGWFDEKYDYSRGQPGCQMSCHYTQLVWDNTNKVGCYSTRCPNLGMTTVTNAWYFVCFYTPMGNMVGEDPYELSCETPCRNGQTEEDGLCVGEAIIPCVDEEDNCAAWQKMGECENNPDFMEMNCRKSCKICTSETDETAEEGTDTGESTEEGSETGGSTEEGPETGGSTEEGPETGGSTEGGSETGGSTEGGSETGGSTEGGSETGGSTEEGAQTGEGSESVECKDDNEHCFAWAATNQCHVNPGYMLVKCKKSCGVCKGDDTAVPEEECVDKNASCEEWAAHNHCKINPGYMYIDCKKSCGLC